MPLYKNYSAIHKSILECAMAGCNSIWIIAEKRHIPIIKAVAGNWIEDPVMAQLPTEFKDDYKIKIPIWYSSLPIKDLGRRDCHGRSVIAGADYAIEVGKRLGSVFVPQKFFVSFPYYVYSPWVLQKSRSKIKSSDTNFFIRDKGKTIKDGKMLGFTFFLKDLTALKKHFKINDPGKWYEDKSSPGGNAFSLKRRVAGEYNIARLLTLDKVFEPLILEGSELLDLKIGFDISSWEGYADYITARRWYRMPKKVKLFFRNKMKNLEERTIESEEYDDYDISENPESGIESD
jgi:hypothetical protein